MKVGIMQPYLFPYIGYWQLINAVDKFVILDDVNYISRGYINRNNILLNGKAYRFTIPIKDASQRRLIMNTKLSFDDKERAKFLKTIRCAYKKTCCYENAMTLIEEIINNKENDLTQFIKYSIEKIIKYLQIETEILVSSDMKKNNELKGEEKIIEICQRLNADMYINPCGGRKLYHSESFASKSIQLLFLDTCTNKIIYDQGLENFEKNLSIIDFLFHNKVEHIKVFLKEYELNSH